MVPEGAWIEGAMLIKVSSRFPHAGTWFGLLHGTGEFHDRTITPAGQPERPIPSYDGSHGTITLTAGGHFDLGASY